MFSCRRASCCLLVFVWLVVAECGGKGYAPPPNCARYECPSYAVVYSNDELEIRSYDDAQWMSTPKISAKSYSEGAKKGFHM